MGRKAKLAAEQNARASFGSRTDIGLVRKQNEDSLVVEPPLYAVCDGMGGHEAGEVASEIAVNVLSSNTPNYADAQALAQAVEQANIAILQAVREGTGRPGMGTTCTAAMLSGEQLVIAQVGDSRAYLLHNGRLQQLTRDHSYVADLVEAGKITPEEARTHPKRSVITRALGSDPHMKPDMYEMNVAEGDRLLLCSDGLYSMVRDEVIEDIMNDAASPQDAADELVDEACARGGVDNVTVVVVDVSGYADQRHRKMARRTKITAVLVIVMLVAILAGAGAAFAYWTNNAAYLGEVDGRVAVYQGIPGQMLGIEFSHLQTVTDVELSSLQPGVQNRIRSHQVQCDSLDDAYALVAEYKEERDSAKSFSSSANAFAGSGASAAGSSASSSAASSAGNAAGAAAANGAAVANGAGASGATGAGQRASQGAGA